LSFGVTGISIGLTGLSMSETVCKLNSGGFSWEIAKFKKKDTPITINTQVTYISIGVTQISQKTLNIFM
jgi:hypothetical protein